MTLVNTDRADKVRKIAELAIRAMGAEHPDGKFVTMGMHSSAQRVDIAVYDHVPDSEGIRQRVYEYAYLDEDSSTWKLDGMIAVLENFLKECGV